jgi:hypothetical protein
MVTERLPVTAKDRVLLLDIPDELLLGELSGKASHGIVVALGDDDAVRRARKTCALLENVMFVPAVPDQIPWKEDFFTVAIDLAGAWDRPAIVARELLRVVSPGGAALVAPALTSELLAVGFVSEGQAGNLALLRKPGAV